MTDSLSEKELSKLLTGAQVPVKVSMLSPLEIFVDRDGLQRLLRRSIKGLVAQREEVTDMQTVDLAIQQRIDFLAYLQAYQDPEIYMAMYPAHEDGLDDEGVWHILNNIPDE